MGVQWSEPEEELQGERSFPPQGEDQDEDYIVVTSPNAKDIRPLRFNPNNSYAVCSGVGHQLNYRLRDSDLGSACDNDAVRMRRAFHSPLGIPYDNIKLLHSGQHYPATQTNMFDDLKEAAEKVKEDGILLFTFSGHGIQQSDWSTVLVPADGTGSAASSLRACHIEQAIKNTKARYTILILDCCHAGTIANELQVHDLPSGTQRFILAACSSAENAMGHQELGSGFFTFFLSNHLVAHPESSAGCLPISQALYHSKEACQAITSLFMSSLREQQKKHHPSPSAKMTPQFVHDIPWHSFVLAKGDSVDGQDVIDGSANEPRQRFDEDAPYSLDFLNCFLSEETRQLGENIYTICDDIVPYWLVRTALPALKTLYRLGYLRPGFDESDDVLRTVLCMMSKSVASIVDRSSGQSSSADLFLVCFIYVVATLEEAFEEGAKEASERGEVTGKLQIKLGHVYLSARHYTAATATAQGVDVGLLKELLEMMLEMQKSFEGNSLASGRMERLSFSSDGDTVDGPQTGKIQELVANVNKIKPTAISHPQPQPTDLP